MRKNRWLRASFKWVILPVLGLVGLVAAIGLLFPATLQSWSGAAVERLLPHYLAWRSGTGAFEGDVTVWNGLRVPMRDGITLATDLYLPASHGPHPVIVVRTPYTKGEGRAIGDFFARYGYAVVIQDVRGRHDSEGEFYPFRSEQTDGADTTRWVKEQEWCNGKIGAFGMSYFGFTQWAMAAGNPDVSSIAPSFITADLYDGIYQKGAFSKLTFLHWSLTADGRYGDMRGADNIRRVYRHFPLREADDVALRDIRFYNDWVDHPLRDDYWRKMSVNHRFSELNAPAFLTSGWYDFFVDAQIRDFQLLRKTAPANVREKTKLLVGPWTHSFLTANHKNYGIEPRFFEVIPFEFVRETKEWLDYSLRGVANGWDSRPAVRAYVLGKNVWRDEQDWPPRRMTAQPHYLHSAGNAATVRGDGALSLTRPEGAEPVDTFVYDPTDPVPTEGGNHGDPWSTGPVDQRKIEERRDVLVFSSEVLEKPLLVMGLVRARLFASSTATDTDFTVKLVDVFPDGTSLIVCEGMVRARYRNGSEPPQLLTPGEVYPFDFDVGNTAVSFEPGHRIRVEVSSSNCPRYDANPNTGREIATEAHPAPATQTIFHTPESPSAVILPVLPE